MVASSSNLFKSGLLVVSLAVPVAGAPQGTESSQLAAALDRVVPSWMEAGGSGDQSRRLHVAALLVLELTVADVYGRSGNALDRLAMVEWACERLRHLPPSEFERGWMRASYAVLQPPARLGAASGSQGRIWITRVGDIPTIHDCGWRSFKRVRRW